ncbi:UNKNOWN [Stylonychia lemnae]|uniref:NAC-A/B domain-containing protein n=1 Tax=Stylonychia lemnae TaxID=5949 RepID=A0A078B842_STYLE|nr:UNKNOWN [Stylonychia lemnae]|eukprot:CDW89452.1 UNKNOWN [Stylonychia lemnae]
MFKTEEEHDQEHHGHDHDHHDHDHHDHDHDHDKMPDLENQTEEQKKLNRGEKKCRKSLIKLGMKQLTGITRVALRKRDGLIFVINDPEVLKSGTNENSYAIFGELKLEDPNSRLTQKEAKKFAEAKPEATADAKEEDKKAEDDSVPLSEDGLTASHIDMVIDHTKCTRNAAIRALRETNDDMVQAVMKLTT